MNTKLFTILFTILFCKSLNCQILNGKVINEKGEPIQGVTVKVEKAKTATSTTVNGIFTILIPAPPQILEFSALCYQPYKVKITPETFTDKKFEVVLLQRRTELSEVVVVGFSSSKRKDITGSVSAPAYGEYKEIPKGFDRPISGIKIEGYSSSFSKSVFSSGRKIAFSDSIPADENGKVLKTKLVTAGELNDFNKWKMWEDFTETQFKEHSIKWSFFAKKKI
jgi:hypothetical protein